MRKYFFFGKTVFQEYLTYRLSFVLWRFRNLISFLALIFLWLALYAGRTELLGYRKEQILTYVIGVAFLRGVVLASRTADLAGRINSGELVKDLLKPIGIMKIYFTRDLVDKLLNLTFSFFEIALVLRFFKFSLYLPKSQLTFVAFLVASFISIILYFLISFWLSLLSFWVDQPWAPRWLFGIIFLEFFSGGIFPLDVLPAVYVKIASLTPFPYLIFFPLKIWLGQIDPRQQLKLIMISLFWVISFWVILKKTWIKGIKTYTAYGG
ncbi:MAG TPA: ABC-2 family transporter protein [Candidatus Bathyarchaeia archaeon]|nr:ABC-2 family transporter protein [Candidatus Bathyarchaeia archaeon]